MFSYLLTPLSLCKIHIFKHFSSAKIYIFKETTISNVLMLIALIFLTLISSCLNASKMEITKNLLIVGDFSPLMDSTNFLLCFC